MKPCEQYLNAMNELVDGTLGPLRRTELELHVESCEPCRALLADLQRIAEAGRSLEALKPPASAWSEIAERLRQEGRVVSAPRRTLRRSHAVLALAAALVLAAGASLFYLAPGDPAVQEGPTAAGQPAPASGNAVFVDPVQAVESEMELTERAFQNVIEKAEAVVNPETRAVLQKNLLVMNEALAESRSALEQDPQNRPARQSFYDTLRQKIQFLQDTIALMNEMRQGDAAGAALIVEGGKS